jgi:hypothetical protein
MNIRTEINIKTTLFFPVATAVCTGIVYLFMLWATAPDSPLDTVNLVSVRFLSLLLGAVAGGINTANFYDHLRRKYRL